MQFTWKSLPCNIKKSDYNTNNHHDRDPYWIDDETDTLVIDENWWNNEVPVTTKELLKERLRVAEGEEITLGKVPIPHDDQFDFRLLQVYQAFQEAFEMQHWVSSTDLKDKVIYFQVDKSNNGLGWDNMLRKVESKTNEKEQNGWFVKTGCTSGKNKVPIYECKTAKEITDRLLSNPEIEFREWNNLEKDSYVFLIPWNTQINERNEFRGFFINGKITCLSPQKFWECHNYTVEELESLEVAVTQFNEYLKENCPYKCCVIDFWVEFLNDNSKAHLIEYNCFGDHSGAGSSLFQWIEDHDLIYGSHPNQPTEIRFLSPISINK